MIARAVRPIVKTGLAAMDDDPADFNDHLCATEAEQAKAVGVSVTTWRDLKKERPPISLWYSDLTRYGIAHKAGSK